MELGVFPRPEVSGLLSTMIEARLNTDRPSNPRHEEILALQKELTGVTTRPVYLIMDPKTRKVYARRDGATATAAGFVDFLQGAAKLP